ncbi:HDOD domain-containing protein [Fundidesulfovibrio butyratiphilus]
MGLVSVDDLRPDMVLSQDVRSRQGRLLFSQGAALDDLAIQTLKFWGVYEAPVSGYDQESLDRIRLAGVDPAVAKAAGDEADRRLALCDADHPAVAALRKTVLFDLALSGAPVTAPERPSFEPQPAPARRLDPARLISGAARLASMPKIVDKVLQALNDPHVSYAYVGELIGKDVGLSAKLLKLVNSALFAFPEPVESVSRAVSVVGINKLTSLALGVSLIDHFDPVPQSALDMRSFWEHSLACAVLARLLATVSGHPEEERAFVAGLLHDIGRLVMLSSQPKLSVLAMAAAWEEDAPLYASESRVWGFHHAKLGGKLLTVWKFPPGLIQAVERHHDPDDQDSALVHVADIMAHALGLGRGGSPLAPPLSAWAWDSLEISPGVLAAVAAQAQHQLSDIGNILLPSPGVRQGRAS